jgi:hypothetical protein
MMTTLYWLGTTIANFEISEINKTAKCFKKTAVNFKKTTVMERGKLKKDGDDGGGDFKKRIPSEFNFPLPHPLGPGLWWTYREAIETVRSRLFVK